MIKLTHILRSKGPLQEAVHEDFSKRDWDVKWKMPKDTLFNATKTTDAVKNRYKALQFLLKGKPKELRAFDSNDNHPAYDMSYDELMKWYNGLKEGVIQEGKMPKKYIGNDEIVYLKTKEDSRGANYNLYYKGHDIDKGGHRFGSEKELKDFASNYILSNQWYRKLRYEDSIPLPE